MRIGFTGTQKGMTTWQQMEFAVNLKRLGCTEFVFGDCIGADIEAANLAVAADVKVFSIYPQNKDSRKRAWFLNPERDIVREGMGFLDLTVDNSFALGGGPKDLKVRWFPAEPPLSRNMRIIDNCDYVIAAPKEFEHTLRSGTWATIRYAWKHKKDKITIIPPVDRDTNV